MALKNITLDDNGIFKKQGLVSLDSKLNIIKGANGSGKTLFLSNILKEAKKENLSICSLLASIQHFKSFASVTSYLTVRPIASRGFINQYKTIAKLMDNKELIESCNNFFRDLKIPTRLNTNNAETGWLLFSNPNHKSKKTIPLEEISPGEKTAFILWLLIQSEQKLDILILDEFDAHLSSLEGINYGGNEIPITKMMYIILIENFINKGVQVFIATNREFPDLSDCGIKMYKKIIIRDGLITISNI